MDRRAAAEAIAIRTADEAEARAMRAMAACAPRAVLGAFRPDAPRIDGSTLLMSRGLPAWLFSRVIGLGDGMPATEAMLDQILTLYRRADCTSPWIHLTPGALPEALPAWLAARGFHPARRRTWAKMLRGREAPPERRTDFMVIGLGARHAAAAGALVRDVFGLPAPVEAWFAALVEEPGWRAFGAFDGAQLVGVGFVYVDGPLAWLGAGATIPAMRGRGAQGALLARRIEHAIALGCGSIVSETGESVAGEPNPSLANLHRVGFQQVCSRANLAQVST